MVNPQQAASVKNNPKFGGKVVAPENDPGMAKKLQGSGLKGALRLRLYGKKKN